ncbi:dapdiamide synthesis protein DdaC-like isoform X1 [Branchiostoma floridae]|uniref:Dapdiamide synthesis protein DdaC-like isoform X1 n=1 Tax=Branchiostoma floridae TaxID=7739 RepID=A0A9J7KKT8_BRAFL|nr:dapdiamide synthesis protein DdaC-like isoform X1 [Branchiostoma floridae]
MLPSAPAILKSTSQALSRAARPLLIPRARALGLAAPELVQTDNLPKYNAAKLAGRPFLPGSDTKGFPATLNPIRVDFPAVFHPKAPADADKLPLEEWGAMVREIVDRELSKTGVLLFRGLPIRTREDYARLFDGTGLAPRDYVGHAGRREQLDTNVYSSNDDPLEFTIDIHTELSFMPAPPQKVMFCCIKSPGEHGGGETPVTDMRGVMRDMDPSLVERVRTRQIRYVRNIADKSRSSWNWQSNMHSEDREEVERFLTGKGFSYRWNADDSLSYWFSTDGLSEHPGSGETYWFNQLTEHNGSCFKVHPEFMNETKHISEFPRHTSYGDGEEFSEEDLAHVREVQWKNSYGFHWRQGDVLVMDNFMVGHGRMGCNPGVKERKIIASITKN